MKRIHVIALFLAVLALACSASDQYSSKSYSTTVSCYTDAGCTSTTIPPVAYSDGGFSTGAIITSMDGFRIKLCANGAQGIGDGGTLDCYYGDFADNTFSYGSQLSQYIAGGGNNCWVAADFKAGFISDDKDVIACTVSGAGVNGVDAGPLTMKIYVHRERFK